MCVCRTVAISENVVLAGTCDGDSVDFCITVDFVNLLVVIPPTTENIVPTGV